PKPVWAVGFALEQTLHVVALAVFSYVDFKVASAYIPKPVWAVGFALEQTLHVIAFTVFSYVDFKVA
ncbi:MAG: hypothetical protein LBH59_08065, partial [Planctomycetaceae bacterium]|nr:hypothetical protein [Planctomycetaceae bacterium]